MEKGIGIHLFRVTPSTVSYFLLLQLILIQLHNWHCPSAPLNMTTEALSPAQFDESRFDYIIVGVEQPGGSLTTQQLSPKILLVEAGPSDFNDDRMLLLKDWLTLLGGEMDYDYETVAQPNGI